MDEQKPRDKPQMRPIDTETTEQLGNFRVNYSTLYLSIDSTGRHVGVRRHLIVQPENQEMMNPLDD